MKKTILLWIAGGVLLVAGAFFLPEQTGSIWPSVILGSIAAFLYLIAFSFVWLKKIESSARRKAIGWTLTVLVVFSFISASISYEGSSRQTELLPEIRTTIETNIAEMYIKEPLLKTLKAYHVDQESRDNISIGSIFKTRYDSLIDKGSVFNYGNLGDDATLTIYCSQISSDSVSLIAESSYIDGRDSGFKNFSGATGQFQIQGILTREGLYYERTN